MRPKIGFLFFLSILAWSCNGPAARYPVQHTSGTFFQESAQRNKEIYEREKDVIEAIAQNDTANTYYTSDRGFWYFYKKKDSTDSPTPKVGDLVTFSYDIQDLEGRVILTSRETGIQKYIIDQSKQELISGIRDGLKLMKEEETITFLFPSYKAYGYYGIVNKLHSNTPVKSTVTLHSIEYSNENQ